MPIGNVMVNLGSVGGVQRPRYTGDASDGRGTVYLCPMKPFTTTARVGGRQARQRVIAAVSIIVVHLTVIAVLTRQRSPGRTAPVVPAMVVTVILTPQLPAPIPREVPVGTALVAPAFEITVPTHPAILPCDLPSELAESFRRDPAALGALAPLAQETTHAVMAWNGAWSDRIEVQALRDAALTTLTTMRADCLDEQMTGPRLVFVEVGATTVTVGFGSGAWTWRELLFDKHNQTHRTI